MKYKLSQEHLDAISERTRQIVGLCNLWYEVTGRTVEEFSAAINKKFSVTDGINSLEFESIETVRQGLLRTREASRKNT